MSWKPTTVGATLAMTADRHPDRVGLVHRGQQATWRELDAWSDRLARALLALGVARGTHVAILMANSLEWAAVFYALGKLGAVAVPVNTRYKESEIAYVLGQSDSTYVVAAATLGGRDTTERLKAALTGLRPMRVVLFGASGGGCPGWALPWNELELQADSVPEEELGRARVQVRPDDPFIIQYTSGTTGFPKGAVLRQDQMIRNATCFSGRMGLTEADRFFSPLPFFHVGGTTLSLLITLVTGARLYTMDRFDPGEALAILSTERCTALCGIETIFTDLMAHPDFSGTDLSSLRTGWSGGIAKVFNTFPGMINIFGLSETSPNVCMAWWTDPLEIRRDTCGKPHEGLEVRIVHPETGADLPEGVAGRILVRGWCVMAGYYNQPEANARVFLPGGWLDTGDLGRVLPGGYLRFEGRLKDVIRVGGENVSAIEIESVLNSHPAILQSAVVPVPDARLMEVPCACVQLNEGSWATADEIRTYCRDRMAGFKVPHYVLFFDAFEITGSAKIAKHVVKKQAIAALGMGG